jgi:cytochrome c oxidase assembly protein subunit 15
MSPTLSPILPLPQHRRAIANWLLVCISLVVLMVFVGGVTRLTESGLSIVEWKLLSGTLPPLSEEAWIQEFEEYKATPQYQQVNKHFGLSEFKGIYWLEYLHRLLGRIIGLAVLIPFLYFTVRGQLPWRLFWRGLFIGGLVAAQGTVGWVMVASGLVDQPRVAPIKLAAHLLLALTVFCIMVWTRWQVLDRERMQAHPRLRRAIVIVFTLIVLQIFFGALVAGLRAGWSYNTWPLMDGQWIPAGLHLLAPWWTNHLESVLTVQFQHRMMAILVLASSLWLAVHLRHTTHLARLGKALAATVFAQFVLGIATLLSGVHIWLASAHQLLALVLLYLLIRLVYLARA